MMQLPSPVDVDDVLRQIRDSLLLYLARGGAVKVVIESDSGEEIQVLKIDHRRITPRRAEPHPLPAASSVLTDELAGAAAGPDYTRERQHAQQHDLLQRCKDQQHRIAELERRLQQLQQEFHHRTPSPSPAAASADLTPLSPTPSTDSYSSSSENPHRVGDGETDEDGHGTNDSTVAMTDDASQSFVSCPRASDDSIAMRRSERSQTNVDRWTPSSQRNATTRIADPSSSRKKHKTKHYRRSHRNDREDSISSDMPFMEVDSADGHITDHGADDGNAAEVAALVAKLREGYDRRQSVALDSLSQESILSLRQHVLEESGDHLPSISGQITTLISTSASLKIVGYFLRAILAHRLKRNSQNCYNRLARNTLGIKSSADQAAYPALYELVKHHYPTLVSAGIEVWLENPIFSADITWSEWKCYLTKQGRRIIDAALQQFNAAVAPFQDWMQLGWVEIYHDQKMGGQGVRALRDIHMPESKARKDQRSLEASISIVAADMHCAGPEFVLSKSASRDADPAYFLQLDRLRVFDARDHWIGKINHQPERLCNLRLTSTSKLVQIKPIAAG